MRCEGSVASQSSAMSIDAAALNEAVARFRPDAVMDQLTDLRDEADIPALGARNDRMRREGTRNLLAAARAARAGRIYAQSIAWTLPGERGVAVAEHERAVLDAGDARRTRGDAQGGPAGPGLGSPYSSCSRRAWRAPRPRRTRRARRRRRPTPTGNPWSCATAASGPFARQDRGLPGLDVLEHAQRDTHKATVELSAGDELGLPYARMVVDDLQLAARVAPRGNARCRALHHGRCNIRPAACYCTAVSVVIRGRRGRGPGRTRPARRRAQRRGRQVRRRTARAPARLSRLRT
jgi:hypothetical protein